MVSIDLSFEKDRQHIGFLEQSTKHHENKVEQTIKDDFEQLLKI